ncbi:MAG TPA: AAA family ATPase, partial [Candidatus Limnocylindrales bacterium]|nr:AAA family ATPase [Candidatus Limnocylindrales bacterium]
MTGEAVPPDVERRLRSLQDELDRLSDTNRRLAETLREARNQIVTLKEEVDRLADPPNGFAVFLARNPDGTADIHAQGRKLRVSVAPGVEELVPGQEVMVNEAMNVIAGMAYERVGEIVMFKELLEGGDRALVIGHTDEERVVRLAQALRDQTIRAGDSLLMDPRSSYVYERIPKSEVEELVLEEIPDVDYADIGGLAGQIEMIRDAVELPYVHAELFKEHKLAAPKGILLYGPPGCGKTMIAKAVAASLARKVAEREGKTAGRSYF